MLASETDRLDLAFGAALAEAARHEDRIEVVERGRRSALDLLGIDVLDHHPRAGLDAGVVQRLVQRLVGVGQVDVLAHHADAHGALGMLQPVDQRVPVGQVCRPRLQAEHVADDLVETLLVQHRRDLVDRIGIPDRNHRIELDVREQRDLRAFVLGDRTVGPAQQNVGRDADLAQLLHAVLRGLGLELTGGRNERHQGEVHEAARAAAQPQAHLASGLDEGQRLDVADGAADLDDRDVGLAAPGRARTAIDEILDFVGDVRDHLHGLAEVLAAPFLLDHRLVDLAGGEVVHPPHAGRHEALVMAEVEVRLGPVFGHEHLSVLERTHRARIDVDVRVELEKGDLESPRFEQRAKRRGGDTFAERGDNTTGDKDVLDHARRSSWFCRS